MGEYTWNGQEWVWSEDKNPSPPVESNEGSGDSYNNFADEDEDDSNFNYDYEGSGNDDEEDAIEDSYSPRQPTDNFQNSRNNYQDPYNTGGNSWNPDPWDPSSNQNNFNTNQQQNNNNFNSQYSPTQQPPYFGNEVGQQTIFTSNHRSKIFPQPRAARRRCHLGILQYPRDQRAPVDLLLSLLSLAL